jgi:DNA-binding NarL/FixJ family response regulator
MTNPRFPATTTLNHRAWNESFECDLTNRELEVLRLVACGHGAIRVAHLLEISERTVHKHLERSYAKLGVHDRLMAVQRLGALGLIPAAVVVFAERLA